ncbi:hypothetical protein ACFZC5_08880 [Nocardia gamkensis]|uniref:hypothetical protein n=1 Tax=Nocardia gamkensis TaxID=352869 RepID=UPI0036EEC889
MNLAGHKDRRTLQRYVKPGKGGTHPCFDARRRISIPGADELAARITAAAQPVAAQW